MKAIDEIREDVAYVENMLRQIEKYGLLNKDFTAKDFYDNYVYKIVNTQMMPSLVRRGIAVEVGTVERTFKKEILFNGKYVEAMIPYEAKVYRIVHDIDWYRDTLIKAVINACN